MKEPGVPTKEEYEQYRASSEHIFEQQSFGRNWIYFLSLCQADSPEEAFMLYMHQLRLTGFMSTTGYDPNNDEINKGYFNEATGVWRQEWRIAQEATNGKYNHNNIA